MEGYKILKIGSLKKYLIAASAIMTFYLLSFMYIVLELRIGIFFGIFCSSVAVGNFLIHGIGYLKKREYRGTIASGVFSSIPLGILGCVNIVLLILMI